MADSTVAVTVGSGTLVNTVLVASQHTFKKTNTIYVTGGTEQIILTNAGAAAAGSQNVVLGHTGSVMGDNQGNPTLHEISNFNMMFDGSTWDRMRGTSTDGVTVNLGTNNDVVVTGNVAHDLADSGNPIKTGGRAVTTLPAAAAANDRVDRIMSTTGGALVAGADGTTPRNIAVNASGQVEVDIAADQLNGLTIDGTVTANIGTSGSLALAANQLAAGHTVAILDGGGTALTSTLVGADQSLDVNLTQAIAITADAGTNLNTSALATSALQLAAGHTVAILDGGGTALTSTLVSADQSLDVNVTQSVAITANAGTNLNTSSLALEATLGSVIGTDAAADGGPGQSGVRMLGTDLTNNFQVLVDTSGHLQTDVLTSALPSGAATSAGQLAADHAVTQGTAATGTGAWPMNMTEDTTDTVVRVGDVTNKAVRVNVVAGSAGATEYTEDAITANPIVGTATLMERDDALSDVTPAEADWIGLRGNQRGALWVELDATPSAGGIAKAEDAIHATGDVGVQALAVHRTADTAFGGGNNDYAPLALDDSGFLKVNVKAGGGTGGTSSSFAAALPATGTAVGFLDGTGGTNMEAAEVIDADLGVGAEFILKVNQRIAKSGGSVEITTGAGGDDGGTQRVTIANDGWTGATNLGKADSTTHVTGDVGVVAMAVQQSGDTALASNLEYAPIQVNASGFVKTTINGIVPGSGSTQLGSNRSSAGGATDVGVATWAIRNDTPASLAEADTEYTPLRVNSTGSLYVTGGGGGTEYSEKAATPDPIVGTASLMERDDALTTLTDPIETEWAGMRCNARGALWVDLDASTVIVTATALDVRALTNADVVTAELSATDNLVLDNIDTAVQLIDDAIFIDDAIADAHVSGTTKVMGMGAVATPTDTAIDANDIGMPAMSLDRRLHVDADIVANGIGLATSSNQLADGHAVTVDNLATEEVFTRLTDGTAAYDLAVADGSAVTTDPEGVLIQGDDGTNRVNMAVAADGAVQVDVTNTPAVTVSSGTITADLGVNNDVVVSGTDAEDAAAVGNPVLVAGRYDTTSRVLETGDVGALALAVDGSLIVVPAHDVVSYNGQIVDREYTFLNATASGNTLITDLGAPGAGLKHVILNAFVNNQGAATISVKFQSATTDKTCLVELAADGGGGNFMSFACGTNEACNFNLSATGTVGVQVEYITVLI